MDLINKFFFTKKQSLRAVYTMHSIDASAFSLVGIFIPIYFLTLGYSVSQVIIYFIIQNSVLLASSFAVGYIGSRYGVQKTLLLRLPFLFLFLAMLSAVEIYHFPLYLLAIFDGWQAALYWVPLNIIFAKNTSKGHVGTEISKLFALPQIFTIFTPLAGGLIAAYFGFNILFAVAISIFITSIIPIFRVKRNSVDFTFHFKKGAELFKKNKKYFWAEICNNFGEETDGIIWPIFIYLTVMKITAVGATATAVSLGAFFLTLAMGRISDRFSKNKLIRVGAVLIMLVWFIRFFIDSELAFYAIGLISGFVFVVFSVPYYAKLFGIPRKSNVDEFFIFREVPVYLGRMIAFCLALIFVDNLPILFPIAGLAYLYFVFGFSAKD